MNIVLFLKSSIGELNVGLPILYFMKKELDSNIYFASSSNDILNEMKVPSSYSNIMSEQGQSFFGKPQLKILTSELRKRKEPTLILTCDSGSQVYERLLRFILKKSHIVHFHHAFALHGSVPSSKTCLEKRLYRQRFLKCSSVLLNSRVDNIWYESVGFHPDKIRLMGALGYSGEWLNKIGVDISKQDKSFKTIFLALRDVRNTFLTENNYNYLVEGLEYIIKNNPDISFIIKLHPRQRNDITLRNRMLAFSNVSFSCESTFHLAGISDLTLSFWSSAITDSLACNTPTIEFHRHEVNHSQLIEIDGQLKSLYYSTGMTKHISSLEELALEIEKIKKYGFEIRSEMLKDQKSRFDETFGLINYQSQVSEQASKLNAETENKAFFDAERVDAFISLVKVSINRLLRKSSNFIR